MAQRRMRIEHAIDDQIILLVRRAEEVSRIVDRQIDAGVGVRTLGMIFGAEECDGRIDLDGIDMAGADPQRGRHIVAAARADDGNALRRFLEVIGKLVIGTDIAVRIGFLTALAVREI